MNKKLTFEDFEKLNNALVDVEKLVHEYSDELIQSKNYEDLMVISKLKLKLDEVESIIIDECRKRK